jgi:thioredoxin 1
MKKVIRFTASWCKPCEALKEILTFVETTVPIEVVDIDENSEIAIEYGVRSVPTMVMVEDNVVLKSIVGIRSKQQLEAWINE